MAGSFIGKAVSIHCVGSLGIFQGHIKTASEDKITIVKAFRNGVPLKKQDMEITINGPDILKLELIPNQPDILLEDIQEISKPTPIRQQPKVQPSFVPFPNGTLAHVTPPMPSSLMNGFNGIRINGKNNRASPCERKKPSKSPATVSRSLELKSNGTNTKPIEVPTPGNSKNDRRKGRRYNRDNSAFGTPVDDPTMDEEFDFEGNLALFDKQAIWDEIENGSEKPDLVRQASQQQQQKKYRHDENVITSKPIQYRQIKTESTGEEYVTDEGLIVPAIPRAQRNRVQSLAESHGLLWERQIDILGRGVTELALQLLGGARRLIPKNQHQWPTISVICSEAFNEKVSETGIAAARNLASHGLKVMLFVKTTMTSERDSKELELYTATGNDFTYKIKELPQSDLIILAVKTGQLSPPITQWLAASRAQIIAIDPPPQGIKDVTIKCSVLPILPIDGIQMNALGKLYLCNLSIPLKFFRDSGIKYNSPFGSKFIIPLHEVKK